MTMTKKQMKEHYGKFIAVYSEGMLARMIEKHDEKRPWPGESPFYLYDQLREKSILFENALENNDMTHARKLAFDIGNFAWMLLDRLEMLEEAEAK